MSLSGKDFPDTLFTDQSFEKEELNFMERRNFNREWSFWKDGREEAKKVLDLPHDAMLEEERDPELENGNATGFYPGGKYIYVKKFYGDKKYEGKSVLMEFEGVYMNSSVFLNDEKIGGWIYGYTNFYVDLTDKIRMNDENELKVIVDNSQTPNSRWYSGSGIYRDVNLYIGEKEHIIPDGVRVTTLAIEPATVRIEVDHTAGQTADVKINIYDNGEAVCAGEGAFWETEIENPKLWSAEHPHLYTVEAILTRDGRILDRSTAKFGIRKLDWDAENGFRVNGQTVKLKGGCIHHDNGPLGACSVYKAEYRRVKKLKELGYNAIRYSHNPTGRLFLDICDEVGMYVLDETFDQWKIPQTKYDYAGYFDSEWKKDIEALVKKDYTHPCVIMYCIGNEITDTGLPYGAALCGMIASEVKRLDPFRPTTIANNVLLSVMAKNMAEKKNVGSQDVNNVLTLLPKIMASITAETQEELLKGVFDAVDIAGYNYAEMWYEKTHEMVPGRVMLSTETFPRKIASNWKQVEANRYLIGDFMWTAWDYLGEAGVGLPFYGTSEAPFSKAYPCLTAGCGSVDITGYVESQGYFTAIVFGAYKKPYIAVRPVDHSGEAYTVGKWRLTDAVNSWSWPGQDGKTAEIEVYGVGTEVELFQDGISLGRKKLEDCRASYQTEYRKGILEAVAYLGDGIETEHTVLKSAGETDVLTIIPEETEIAADGKDLAYVNIQITDGEGIIKMLKDRKISVQVEGRGVLKALASGNPETTERFFDDSYTSYHGRLLAIVQSSGEAGDIRISASAEGCIPAETVIYAK